MTEQVRLTAAQEQRVIAMHMQTNWFHGFFMRQLDRFSKEIANDR